MKTIKKVEVTYQKVKEVPETLSPNVLYVVNYEDDIEGCLHLCLCGCGNKSWLPFDSDGWSYSEGSKGITIKPSVLQRYKCKSHYIITNSVANFV